MGKDEVNQAVRFGPYEITGCKGQVLQRNRPLALSPKAVAVLWTLVQRPGQVVSKDELFTAVWPETIVSEGVLTSRIRELRQALGDTTAKPRYIETVSRRGYRFIAPVAAGAAPVSSSTFKVPRSSPPPTSDSERETPTISQPGTWNLKPETLLVGREAELAQLHSLLAKAASGERQVVFVTGEAGIGKTALIEAFLAEVRSPKSQEAKQKSKIENQKSKIEAPAPNTQPLAPVFIAQGQCIEHYGAGEAYLPVLEAVARLSRQPEGARIIGVLRQVAPTWLVQLPALLSETEYAALRQKVAGATRERMLREMAEALDALSAERPLVVVLEDLHWSDVSTIDLLSMVARRQGAARLMILGTYRPAEVVVANHPLKTLKHELVARGQGVEVPLNPLAAEDVQTYLARRFTGQADGDAWAAFVYRRTEGHPLFMVQVTDYLAQQRTPVGDTAALAGVAQTLPQGLRELIEAQAGRLTAEERQTLEAASVAGAEFAVAGVAAGLARASEEVETICERLAQRGQFIAERELERWPDGTLSGGYGFRHAVYQEVLYQRLSASRRARLHTAVGERLERGYGERAGEVAAELAMHFERGSDLQRTVRYLHQAGENALRRHAYREASEYMTRALTVLRPLPVTPEHTHQELVLQTALGAALIAAKGQAAPEVGTAYARARELCRQVEDTSQLFEAVRGLRRFYSARGEHKAAWELGQQGLHLAQTLKQPPLLVEARAGLGLASFFLGELRAAREHLEHGAALYDSHQWSPLYEHHPGVLCLNYAAWALWLLGYPDRALQRNHEALRLAQELALPAPLAFASHFTAVLYSFCQEHRRVKEHTTAVITRSIAQGLPLWLAYGRLLHGWVLVEEGRGEEGMEQMQQNLAALRTMGAGACLPYFLGLLAGGCGKVGRTEDGLAMLADALEIVEKTGERWYEAELYRIKGELTLQQLRMKNVKLKMTEAKDKGQKAKVPSTQHLTPSTQVEAEACFHKAVEVSRRQQAKSLELRAVMSLARLWRQQGKAREAHRMLAEVYNWFTEGFDTKDLQEAKTLLDELAGHAPSLRKGTSS